MRRLVLRNGFVTAFVETFVAVGNVTRRAPHAPEVPTFGTSFDRMMTTIALLTNVCIDGLFGVIAKLIEFIETQRIGQRLVGIDKDVWFEFLEPFHITSVGVGAEAIFVVLRILDRIVRVLVLVPRQRTERPTRALNLPRLGHHQTLPLHTNLLRVTLTAGFLVHPWTAGVRVEIVSAVGDRFVFGLGCVAIMTYDAPGRVTRGFASRHDLRQHFRADLADRFDLTVTRHTARLRSLGKMIDQPILGKDRGGGDDPNRQSTVENSPKEK